MEQILLSEKTLITLDWFRENDNGTVGYRHSEIVEGTGIKGVQGCINYLVKLGLIDKYEGTYEKDEKTVAAKYNFLTEDGRNAVVALKPEKVAKADKK